VTYHGTDHAGTGFYTSAPNSNENLQYFYHSDHLGSSSLITNLDGNIVQHLEYVPFGEVFIEERNNTWNTPYKFNAKELDEETGLYYYGARYMDPRTGVWLSADPLGEKYPGVSSYVYCYDNPVKFVDPNGSEIINGLDKSNPDNSPLLKAVTKMKLNEDPKVINIYAHGNQNAFAYYDKKGKVHLISDAKGLQGFLDKNSKVWQKRNKEEKIMIVLHSCETGKETSENAASFAREGSKIKNTIIIAPNENIVVTSDGVELGSMKEQRDKNGKIVSAEYGDFWQFENGNRTNTYTGDSKVGTKEFDSSWNKIKQFFKKRL
ncbi:MAG: hypothetical protein M0P26_04825, partial [Bacteroidales bacterium]|nr:hypothetical protein [Bacteroidales bacterium]